MNLQEAAPELLWSWSPLNDINPSDVTPGSHIEVWWVCEKGHEWKASLKNRVRGSGCPVCAGRKIVSGVNDLAFLYPELMQEWHPDNAPDPTQLSPGSKFKALWRGTCGHEWHQTIQKRTYRGQGCHYCSKAGTKILSGFNDLATKFPEVAQQWSPKNPIMASEVFPMSNQRFLWAGACGHEWESTVANRTANKAGCPFCMGKRIQPGFNDLGHLNPSLASEWHPTRNERTPQEVALNSNYLAWWVCSEGHEWQAKSADRNGYHTGCPTCSMAGTSRMERDLAEWVAGLVPTTLSDRSLLGGREIDILCPEQKVGIEFNGVYWHSEGVKGPNYHRDKSDSCTRTGTQLVHIWEDDWRDKPEVVKRMLTRKLGVSKEPRLNARSLEYMQVDFREAQGFLDETHIQGGASGSWRGGLYDAESLVALMVMKRRNRDDWELVRFATSSIVRGGHSRLLSRAIAELSPRSITTFADRGVSDGGLYRKSGFVIDGVIAPDYMYVVRGTRSHKFNYRKSRFRKDPALKYHAGLTERQLADLNGLTRIYDAGKVRWVLKLREYAPEELK